jgi:hypothetical protein
MPSGQLSVPSFLTSALQEFGGLVGQATQAWNSSAGAPIQGGLALISEEKKAGSEGGHDPAKFNEFYTTW